MYISAIHINCIILVCPESSIYKHISHTWICENKKDALTLSGSIHHFIRRYLRENIINVVVFNYSLTAEYIYVNISI